MTDHHVSVTSQPQDGILRLLIWPIGDDERGCLEVNLTPERALDIGAALIEAYRKRQYVDAVKARQGK